MDVFGVSTVLKSNQMNVTYKAIGDNVEFSIHPLRSGVGEVLSLESTRKRAQARSGLIIKSKRKFALGSPVELEMKFPGQENKYRAKCIVSWMEDAPSEGEQHTLGVTITGMDKLDKYGISLSIKTSSKQQQNVPDDASSEWNLVPSNFSDADSKYQDEFERNRELTEQINRSLLQFPDSEPPDPWTGEYSETFQGDVENSPTMAFQGPHTFFDADEKREIEAAFKTENPADITATASPPAEEEISKSDTIPPTSQDRFIAEPSVPEPSPRENILLHEEFQFSEPPVVREPVTKTEPVVIDFDTPAPDTAPREEVPEPLEEAPLRHSEAMKVFGSLVNFFPDRMWDEPVYIDEVFVLPEDRLPQMLRETINNHKMHTSALITLNNKPNDIEGRIYFITSTESSFAPPLDTIEDLLRRQTNMPVRADAITHFPRSLDNRLYVARIAAATKPLKSVCIIEPKLMNALFVSWQKDVVRQQNASPSSQKSIPLAKPMPVNVESTTTMEEDATESINITVDPSGFNPNSIPIRARISAMPTSELLEEHPSETGVRFSIEIDGLLAEAFEGMASLYEVDDMDKAAEFALALALRLIPCAGGAASLIAPERFELYVAATGGNLSRKFVNTRLSANNGLMGYCMQKGKVIRTRNPEDTLDALSHSADVDVYDIMCAPIMNGGELPLGVIEIFNSKAKGGFNKGLADLLSYIAKALGEHIFNAVPESAKRKRT